MARSAQWNNIKPVLLSIPQVMMILLGGFVTMFALEIAWPSKAAISNRIVDCVIGLYFVWVFTLVFLNCPQPFFFAFLGLLIFLIATPMVFYAAFCLAIFVNATVHCCFPFFRLIVFSDDGFMTHFAEALQAIFCSAIFVKIRRVFDLLALAANFGLNCISHYRLLTRRLWLRSFALPIRAFDLFNNTGIGLI
jgi:hypothetical protein